MNNTLRDCCQDGGKATTVIWSTKVDMWDYGLIKASVKKEVTIGVVRASFQTEVATDIVNRLNGPN